jgi:hypothetical protein
MGSMAEDAVLKYLGHGDFATRLEVCKILKFIGTKASVKTLQMAARN